MTRKFKILGLALCAAALAVVAPAAAQAETGVLTTAGFPSIVTGEQQGVVTFDVGASPIRTVTCAANLDATLFGPTDPVTFQPTYKNCSSEPGGLTPVTVTLNGCDY